MQLTRIKPDLIPLTAFNMRCAVSKYFTSPSVLINAKAVFVRLTPKRFEARPNLANFFSYQEGKSISNRAYSMFKSHSISCGKILFKRLINWEYEMGDKNTLGIRPCAMKSQFTSKPFKQLRVIRQQRIKEKCIQFYAVNSDQKLILRCSWIAKSATKLTEMSFLGGTT